MKISASRKISLIGNFFTLFCIFCVQFVQAEQFDANNPELTGYQMVFDDEFDTLSTIDLKGTKSPGFKWYTTPFFVSDSSSASSLITIANGILTLSSAPHGAINGNIATAAPAKNPQGWVGSVFGGGAYFEAKIAFDSTTIDTKNGWPAFWSMSIEHMALRGEDHWEGQVAGYSHFIEDDFFEYDTAGFAGRNSYGAVLHDWYGVWKETCLPAFCDINSNVGGGSRFNNGVIKRESDINWNLFHVIGQLWVPSTKANNCGYIQNYFDGNPTTKVSWQLADKFNPSSLGDFSFNIIEKSHLVVILGTGVNQPMRVDWVRVWQHKD